MILHAVGLTVKINEKPTAQNSVPWLRGSPNGFGILLVQTPLPMGLHIPQTNIENTRLVRFHGQVIEK